MVSLALVGVCVRMRSRQPLPRAEREYPLVIGFGFEVRKGMKVVNL